MFCNMWIIVSLTLLWNYDLVLNVINMYNLSGTPDNIISLKLVLGYVWYVKCVLLGIVRFITNSTYNL